MFQHPHKNPAYEAQMQARREAQRRNRDSLPAMKVAVPKQPNKYLPHYGAKEAAKYATRAQVAA
jgi:hypothetical protein